MSIKYFSYKIPNRKKKLLTKAFLEDFIQVIDKCLSKKTGIEALSERTYNNAYLYMVGSGNVQTAIEITSKKHNVRKAIAEYHSSLPWYDSDMFEDELFHLAIDKGIIEMGVPDEDSFEYAEDELLKLEKEGLITTGVEITEYKGYRVVEKTWAYTDKLFNF